MDKNDLAKKWFEKAESDFVVAVHVFEDLHPKQIEIACYHCQQSSEKALKGYLVSKETEPPKTHDLITLCKLCAEIDPLAGELLEECGELTLYATTTRYPDNIEFTEGDAQTAIKQAKHVLEFMREMAFHNGSNAKCAEPTPEMEDIL
ncbi:hypothetical protein FACS1894187_14770 [Synergistales bacterium]|nr:hypothetical protein FACS1894187_14770 [Synergistales bacterium]